MSTRCFSSGPILAATAPIVIRNTPPIGIRTNHVPAFKRSGSRQRNHAPLRSRWSGFA
jgi:hypothetical protein